MTQINRNLSGDNSSVDSLTPLVKRRDNCKKASRSLSLGNFESEARQLNQSFGISLRNHIMAEDYIGRSDRLLISHSFIKYNKTFHKLFPEIPKEENLTHAFTCALQREVLYHGKLYVSDNNLCFYSSVLLKETKVVIAISRIEKIKKHNPTLSVLSVQTSSGEKYFFASLRNYSLCYGLLQSLCCQEESPKEERPYLSSLELEAEHDVASSFSSLEDGSDHVDLNTSVAQKEDEGTDANDSWSSTQDSSFINENSEAGSWMCWFLEKVGPLLFSREILSLRVVVYIFLFLMLLLLLVSGYIGLRITALEKQLSSLGALTSQYTEYQET
ncbi:GRAM domain-containing protein 2A-like [Cyprinodon tularosa]|uniref:GRAM domain-containing protein 2A-like n=1 Tax=Cyprinodon tularosa TaxID=77115 RepID=UPI0018E1FF60|nr:GRAM domain-containing protein 2A-like [Cyprinodon tularosa]